MANWLYLIGSLCFMTGAALHWHGYQHGAEMNFEQDYMLFVALMLAFPAGWGAADLWLRWWRRGK